MEKPENISVTHVARNRLGAYSATSATEFGTTPPMPRPAIKRSSMSSCSEVAHTDRSVSRPKNRLPDTIARLRPKRSPK